MDAAKVIAVAATNDAPIRQFAGYHRIPRPGLPLVLIPTTGRAGSEVTKVAVITDTERDVKMMMLDVHLLASVALVDFELSLTMPPGSRRMSGWIRLRMASRLSCRAKRGR